MSQSAIKITYDGGDANQHAIDARLLGQSLQGIGRLVSDCLFIFAFARLPKRNETVPLHLKVKEPKAGSYGLEAYYNEASAALALSVPIITQIGPDIISHYVTAVIDKFRGKDEAVDIAIQKMAEMHKTSLDAMTEAQRMALATVSELNQQRHEEVRGMQELLRVAISGSGQAAADYVAPVGRSVDTAKFVSGGAQPLVVDKEDADAIRNSQKLDWTSIEEFPVRTDGFRFHTSGLSVENPDGGYLMAEVDDELFYDDENPYTIAAAKRGQIVVKGRIGRKGGRIARIKIYEFVRAVDD